MPCSLAPSHHSCSACIVSSSGEESGLLAGVVRILLRARLATSQQVGADRKVRETNEKDLRVRWSGPAGKAPRWRRSFRHLRGEELLCGTLVGSFVFRLPLWGKKKKGKKKKCGDRVVCFNFGVWLTLWWTGGEADSFACAVLLFCRWVGVLLLTKMVTMGASMPLVREVLSSTVLANAHSSSSGTSASYSSKILTSSLAPKSCRVRDAGNALRRCVTLSTRAAPKCAVSPRIAWGSDLLMVITIGEKMVES